MGWQKSEPRTGARHCPGERQHQVAGAAADIQHARAGPLQNGAHAAHRAGAPEAVDIEREQVVGQVVAVRHAAEHAAHPGGGFLLVARARGRRALHDQGGPDGVEHQLLVDARHHRDLADAHRQHEVHLALHGLLVVHQAREQVCRGNAVERRNGAVELRSSPGSRRLSSAERWPVDSPR